MLNKASWKILLLCGLLASCTDTVKQTHCLPLVAVYPSWHQEVMPIAQIPWDRLTHLVLIFAVPNASGDLVTSPVDQLIGPLRDASHERGKQLYLSIGGAQGYGDAFQQIMRSPEKEARFVQQVVDYAVAAQLDGIDIDWEYWTWQATQNRGGTDPVESQMLVRLLKSLRAALPQQIALTTSVFAGHWMGDQYLSELQESVDYVALMSYDFTGSWPQSDIGHHADFRTFKASVDYLRKRGFREEKILAGIPFYGKEFVDNQKTQVIDHHYRDILKQAKAEEKHINRGRLGNIYYETPELVQKKAQYILNNKLAGVMIFEITQDTPEDEASLSLAINNIISPSLCNTP